jgi:polygalacturonase
MTRRSFLMSAAAGMAVAQDWPKSVLDRIKAPVFPSRDFNITRYGAAGDGKTNCTQAIAKAIEACSQAGGGRVIVPRGNFFTGAIHLKNNVNLRLDDQATLRFSNDPKHYLPVVFTRWEGTECMNFSPLIYAFEQSNIAITGAGTLDGGADCDHWWVWTNGPRSCNRKPGGPNQRDDRNALMAMGDKGTPVAERIFGDGHFLRTQFIQPYRSTNVLIDGVTIVNSPMWEIHPVLCRNVIVRGVNISTHGPNNDGCDPESSSDVLIENCTFDTGDDCIAIKSGRNADGRRVNQPCENLIIRDCTMKDGHGGVSIGSEASGNVRNVLVERCRMSSPNLQRALRIKSNTHRGGVIENVVFRDVTVGEVAEAVVEVDFNYEEGAGGPFTPVVRNVNVGGVKSRSSKHAVYLRGFPSAPIRDIHLSGCDFENVAQANVIENVIGLSARDVRINGKIFVQEK